MLSTFRNKPVPPDALSSSDRLLLQAFARLSEKALGAAVGAWAGLGVFIATAVLVVKDGLPVGPMLGLLSQYLPGYSVSWTGSVLGLAYGFILGFALGWSIAFLRNLSTSIYLRAIRLKSDMSSLSDFLDN